MPFARRACWWVLTIAAVYLVLPRADAEIASDAEIAELLRGVIDIEQRSVGMAVGVQDAQGRRIISYGKRRLGDDQPPGGDTVFEIGSITKVFTALLLSDMALKGEVVLGDPVQQYLPASVQVPQRWGRSISLDSLAMHNSGLPRMPGNFKPAHLDDPHADYTAAKLYEFLNGYELTRVPWGHYEYSNLGAGLLGHALTLKAGVDYETLVRTRISEPLGLASTRTVPGPDMAERLAAGYDGLLRSSGPWSPGVLVGAGGLKSTVNDLLTFLAAHLDPPDSSLKQAMAAMLKDRRETGIAHLKVALGWFVWVENGREIVFHTGGTGGYTAFAGFDQVNRVAVAALMNGDLVMEDFGIHILDPRHPPPARLPVHARIDPSRLDSYVGRYRYERGDKVLAIWRDGDYLLGQETGRDGPVHLLAHDEHVFFVRARPDITLTFEQDRAEPARRVKVHTEKGDIVAQRID